MKEFKLLFFLIFPIYSFSQTKIKVVDFETNKGIKTQLIIEGKNYYTSDSGTYTVSPLLDFPFKITARSIGYQLNTINIQHLTDTTVIILLSPLQKNLKEVSILQQQTDFGIERMRSVEGVNIFAGKKTELIIPDKLTFNKATNNARQMFSKIPGLNVWESDGAGLQMGIGGRGLSPNRNSNFNIRQNGYDISADALGYPESYYTPAAEAIQRIELTRGAASLQYGTQFGGLVNFILKQGPEDTPLEITSRNTIGSWWFFNTFNSIGGSYKQLNYYGYYQFKRGNGWRPNSNFTSHQAHLQLQLKATSKHKLSVEYTLLNYLAKQAGGLTDTQFEKDPKQSFRNRNWFKVNWNLLALIWDYQINKKVKLNMRNFLLSAERDALGILTRINEIDRGQQRDLWIDNYLNFGNETRILFQYKFIGNFNTLLTGFRIYKGNTKRIQGFGDSGNQANFNFENPLNPGHSSYSFPGFNAAFFAEHIFNFPKNIMITPGVRIEYIYTAAKGNYNITLRDFAGNIINDTLIAENRERKRPVYLFGLGISWKPIDYIEMYGNISQNYRSITFSDLRIVNPNFKIDENIQDEKGFNADLGLRGQYKEIINFDISGFCLLYNNRIGVILQNDTVAPFLPYRYRTNIGKSLTAGVEAFAELEMLRLCSIKNPNYSLSIFLNSSFLSAKYIASKENSVIGNDVELVPPFVIRSGLQTKIYNFKFSYQFSYVHKHYTDASNAERTSTAVNGLIPSYYVMDVSAQYQWKWFQWEAGVNNVTNNKYFTRRAEGYPGPGIIPSDAISFYLGMQIKLRPLEFRKR